LPQTANPELITFQRLEHQPLDDSKTSPKRPIPDKKRHRQCRFFATLLEDFYSFASFIQPRLGL
jgi:hypothetical protein